jgi:hypothetical protein
MESAFWNVKPYFRDEGLATDLITEFTRACVTPRAVGDLTTTLAFVRDLEADGVPLTLTRMERELRCFYRNTHLQHRRRPPPRVFRHALAKLHRLRYITILDPPTDQKTSA